MRNFQDIAFIWTQTYTDIFKSALEYEDITKIKIRRYYFYKDVNQKRKITTPNVWFLSPSGIIWIIFRCILMNPMHYSLPQSPTVPIFDAPVSNSNNNSIQEIPLIPIADTRLCACLCVCVCVSVCVYVHSLWTPHLSGQLECQGTDQGCCVEDASLLRRVPSSLL